MPKEGWSSMSIDDEVIQLWQTTYLMNKTVLKQRGITSFTGFLTSIMYGVIHDPELMMQAIEIGNQASVKNFKGRK